MLRKMFALAVAVCVDLAIYYYMLGFAAKKVHGHLMLLWVSAILRCLSLLAISRFALGSLKPVVVRFITGHSLLASVYETGRQLVYGCADEGVCGPLGGAGSWLLYAGASALAALFWEITVPDSNDEANGKKKKQKTRVLFMRVLHFYKIDYLLLLGAFVFLTLAVLCEMFIPFYTGKVIDILRGQYDWNEFLSAIIFMGLFSFGSSFSAGCRGGLFMCAINSFTCRMKVKLFGSLVKQDIGFFETTKTGDITCRLSRDTTLMARAVALNVNVLLRTLIKTVGTLSLMMNLSWKLTLLMLMEMPITGLIQKVHDTHYQKMFKAMQDSIARANQVANEAVSSVRVVRSFNMEVGEARRYDNRLMDTHRIKTRRDTIRIVYLLIRRLTGLGMHVATLYYGRLFIQRGQMSIGSLVSFILYQSNLGDHIRSLIYNFGDMLNSVEVAGEVFEYLDREPQVCNDGSLTPDQLKGRVVFNNVTFSYPLHPDKTVLQDFCLELKPGQRTALVGLSGQGKTTCVSLLERFYEPQNGTILLDGNPLQSLEHKFLHRKIALVSQEPTLFSGSIRDNIAYGLERCSLDEIQEAARRANAHNFIIRLEKGYDTEVGEGGSQLSVSEKQRIAIARALVRQPQVLILDEVTSSLDTEIETKVQQALACYPSQTQLVIAHRLKTIEAADQIAVIVEGKVEEQGTHQELIEKKGSYYRLREKLFTNGDTPH